jgi:Fasciclin domain
VHFNNKLSLPQSATDTIYDIATEIPEYSTQIAYIDTVYLDADMKRLSPLTAMYAPNKEWEGKKTKMEEIAKNVLESHMFEKMLWCGLLRNMTGQTVTSLNEKQWNITINDANFPCFNTLEPIGADQPKRACITKCDILARNGIVHELDTLLLLEAAETKSPSAFGGNFPSDSGTSTGVDQAPHPPTVFHRPSPSTISAPGQAPAVQPGAGEKSGAVALSLVAATGVALMVTALI